MELGIAWERERKCLPQVLLEHAPGGRREDIIPAEEGEVKTIVCMYSYRHRVNKRFCLLHYITISSIFKNLFSVPLEANMHYTLSTFSYFPLFYILPTSLPSTTRLPLRLGEEVANTISSPAEDKSRVSVFKGKEQLKFVRILIRQYFHYLIM